MLWASLALAGTLSGMSLPSVGGTFAGPTESGAMGVVFQPAAAHRGEAPELAVDVAAVATSFQQRLDGWDETVGNRGTSVQPTLMLAVPVGRFGFGAAVHSSYLRSTNYDPQGPQRLFIVDSNVSLYQVDLLASGQVFEWLSLGAGLRLGMASYRNHKGLDLAATLNAAGTVDPPLPVNDPLFQGSQTIGPLRRFGASFVLGASTRFDVGLAGPLQFDVSFRPNWRFRMQGPVQLRPSEALNATVDGTIDLELNFPAHVFLAGRIPVTEKWTVIAETQWIGWKRASRNQANISGLYLSSSDPALREVLESAGLTEADFIKSQEGPTDADLQWTDVFDASLSTVFTPHPDWEVRGGLGFSPSAIPSHLTTPSNVDFGVITFQAGAAWQPHPAVRVGVGLERYQGLTRRVTDSPYRLENPEPGTKVQPSGNGSYAFGLWRAGLTLQAFIPSRKQS